MNTVDNPFIKQQKDKRNYLFITITLLAIIITTFALTYFFVFTPNEVSGDSMMPNLEDGQVLLVSRPHSWFYGSNIAQALGLAYGYGDVVVFTDSIEGNIVKRIIGLPGDSVRIENGVFYVNDIAVNEQFEILNSQRLDGDLLEDGGAPVQLGENEFFLAGDNRDISFDSRSIGAIPIEDIKGKVVYVLSTLSWVGSGDLGF